MNFTFENVNKLSLDELRTLPKQQIVECVLAALDDGDLCSVLEFAFSQFPTILSLNEINILIGEQVLPVLKNGFDNIVASAESDFPIVELAAQVQNVFLLFNNLLDSIHKIIDDGIFALLHVGNILLCTLHFMKIATAQDFLYSENDVKILSDRMQMSVTKLLTSPKFKLNESLDELSLCRKVLRGLVELAHEQSLRNDIKPVANTWKHVLKLAKDFRSVNRTLPQKHPLEFDTDDSFDWMTFCVQQICRSITFNVNKLQEMVGNREKRTVAFEKITSFYQKLLQNLSTEYTNEDFRGQSDFIHSYELIVDTLENCVDADFRNFLMLLSNEFGKVLSNVFNCDRFATELLANSRSHHIRLRLEVMKRLLEVPESSKDWYLNYENMLRNIFHHLLFDCIPKETNRIFRSIDLHNEIVQVCASMMLTTADEQISGSIQKILMEATLTNEVDNLLILADIWFIFLRNLPNESQFLYCKYWLTLNQQTSPISRTPSKILIERLLKYTFNLLSDGQRSQIIKDMTQDHTSSLAVLGSDIPKSEVSILQRNTQQNLTKLKEILAKLNPSSEFVSSNECLELINALACFRSPAPQHLLSLLNDPELTNCLTDSLFRCKTRPVRILLSTVLRILLWQKYLNARNGHQIEIDYSDSSEVRQFYAIELMSIAKRTPDRISTDLHRIFEGVDDLTKARMQKTIKGLEVCVENGTTDSEQNDYFCDISNTKRTFGCSICESCLNPNAALKRTFEQIVIEVNKLHQTCENNSRVNLKQFSNEISYINNFFSQLQRNIS